MGGLLGCDEGTAQDTPPSDWGNCHNVIPPVLRVHVT